MIDTAEIERRKPAWAALSELWLDTELTKDDLHLDSRHATTCYHHVGLIRELFILVPMRLRDKLELSRPDELPNQR